ncbi:unnamed protein product [Arctia plantaginis]|uniref:Uncharacterized protein n=1 Tax=Arctia plantaginis TaxID=874455 RepID=A0A8S1ARB7_ARCPL|nr:unnamed protein product [Arctia plantaginis]
MPISRSNIIPYSRSYSSLFDLFSPISFKLFRQNNPNELKEQSIFHTTCKEPVIKSLNAHSKGEEYVTSEKVNNINNNISSKTLVNSASTIFYDLDDIAKRHSFHCIPELGQSVANLNLLKVMRMKIKHNTFVGQPNAIVQECATQMKPKLLPRDSNEIRSKKVKKKISKNPVISSEIFLRDDEYGLDNGTNDYYIKHGVQRPQKFWSYSKYRTEYTRSMPKEKKLKHSRDTGKHNEDPCPCQLFSYACPCTDKKSLTGLAKHTKSMTMNNQNTSTSKIIAVDRKDNKSNNNKIKKNKQDTVREDKPTNTSVAELIEAMVQNESDVTIQQNLPTYAQNRENIIPDQGKVLKNSKNNNKPKIQKKPRKILCPNCNEEVDIVVSTSTTEEEESLKYENSMINSHEIPSTAAYTYRASPTTVRTKHTDDDLCVHNPPCEILPICQILPNEFYNMNQKCLKNNSSVKATPRVIRITKACRHHPPCTVVPSCQRANVLNNNCEYIPPCLHRPRCVNLPLCVPFSKSLHYEEGQPKFVDDIANSECPHIPRYVKQMGKYGKNIHTLRCEDKSTNPITGAETSFSTASITSIDSECPSHGRRVNQYLQRTRSPSGFRPHAAYVTAFSAVKGPQNIKYNGINKSHVPENRDCQDTFPVRCHRSFIKGKYKKMFSLSRRRKSRLSNHLVNHNPKKTCLIKH